MFISSVGFSLELLSNHQVPKRSFVFKMLEHPFNVLTLEMIYEISIWAMNFVIRKVLTDCTTGYQYELLRQRLSY